MKKLKLLSAVVAAGMVLTATAAGCSKKADGPKINTGNNYPTDGSVYNDFDIGGRAIIGSATQLGGDFRWTGIGSSSANASDQDIVRLTSGYDTMELNQNGTYVWNATSVESHTAVENDQSDGTKTYTITFNIKQGLKLSDGNEVTADNYLAYILAMSTPVSSAAFGYNRAGYSFVGWEEYSAYDGTNDATEGVSKTFAGVRKLGDYKFSVEVNSDNYPYYYADTLGAISCYDTKLVLGESVEIKDDGEGAYLDGGWYTKTNNAYSKVNHLTAARNDVSTYAYTGAYVIKKWDVSNSEATLEINPNYAGNFEGQKPHVQTIVYRLVEEKTQFAQLSSGEVDILSALTGAESVNQAISLARGGRFKNVKYDRAGYGKIQFDCDFGPAADAAVRQAVAYCLDRDAFANAFCGGYGTVVNGPYSVYFDGYIANQDYFEENLKSYSVNTTNAKAALEAAGWIYDANGNAYSGTGIRYKKLTAEEAKNTANTGYKSVSNTSANFTNANGYQTVKIGNDYYMPCVINWFGSSGNPVTELLTTNLLEGTMLYECGVGLTLTTGDFTVLSDNIYRDGDGYTGTPTYSMYNLATGWNSAVYDYSYNWIDNSNSAMYNSFFDYSANKLSDPYDAEFSWWNTENQGLTYDEAMEKSGGKLGMNYISFAMVYSVNPGDTAEYNKWFAAYMIRWNDLLPDIPLYGNVYYDCYNSKLLNFKTSPFFGAANALLYCGVRG